MVTKTQPRPAGKQTVTTGNSSTSVRQQVAVRENESTLAMTNDLSNLPDFMRDAVGVGTENIGREDMDTPRLKLLSSVNEELQTYDEARPGMFFHTSHEEVIEGPFLAVPIYCDKRYILWKPREDGGGILARADDAKHWSPSRGEFTVRLDKKDGGATVTWRLAPTVEESGLANWGTMNPNDNQSQPAATLMYNFVLAFPDRPDLLPAVFTFQRGSAKAGRKFNTKLKTIRAPIFGTVFDISSEVETNNRKQDYYVPVVKARGFLQDRKLYQQYEDLNVAFSEKGLQVRDLESAQDDAGSEEPAQPEKGKPRY